MRQLYSCSFNYGLFSIMHLRLSTLMLCTVLSMSASFALAQEPVSSSVQAQNPLPSLTPPATAAISAPLTERSAQESLPAPIDQRSANAWVVNFQDTDLHAAVLQVAEIIGGNYIIPPGLAGKVTIVSQTPLNKHELKELMLTMLAVNGFTVVSSGGGTFIIQPNADARKGKVIVDKRGNIQGETFVTRVLPVRYADLNDLIQAIQPLMSDYAVVKPLVEASALLIADKADNVQKVATIISELDYKQTDEVETVKLTQSWVGNVMPMLEKLAPRELGAGGKGTATPMRVVGDERTNTIMLKGDAASRKRIRDLINQLDQPDTSGVSIQVIPLRNADAVKMADMLKDIFTNTAAAQAPTQGGTAPAPYIVSIKANQSTNALVVHAPPTVVDEIRKILVQLDVPRPQILIEAAIVEVNDELLDQLGVQFGIGDAAFKGGLIATSLTPSPSAAGAASVTGGLGQFLQDKGVANSGLIGGGITGITNIGDKFSLLVQALSADARANLLSTPSITTVNNEEAKIVVGQNVPFRTGSFENSATGPNPFTTIQRQDIGVTLKVTPQINENNAVLLKVEQEVSSLQPTSVAGAADIITNKRTINTTVLADNRQTIALGGLISDDKTTARSQVPFLGDIPVLGLLFQNNQANSTKRDLVVFLRPTILNNSDDIDSMNMRKMNGLWELNLGAKSKKKPLGPDNVKQEMETFYEPDFTKQHEFTPLPWLDQENN